MDPIPAKKSALASQGAPPQRDDDEIESLRQSLPDTKEVFLAIDITKSKSVLQCIPLIEGCGKRKLIPSYYLFTEQNLDNPRKVLLAARYFRLLSESQQSELVEIQKSLNRTQRSILCKRQKDFAALQEQVRSGEKTWDEVAPSLNIPGRKKKRAKRSQARKRASKRAKEALAAAAESAKTAALFANAHKTVAEALDSSYQPGDGDNKQQTNWRGAVLIEFNGRGESGNNNDSSSSLSNNTKQQTPVITITANTSVQVQRILHAALRVSKYEGDGPKKYRRVLNVRSTLQEGGDRGNLASLVEQTYAPQQSYSEQETPH